jgi:hypothetical protein
MNMNAGMGSVTPPFVPGLQILNPKRVILFRWEQICKFGN